LTIFHYPNKVSEEGCVSQVRTERPSFSFNNHPRSARFLSYALLFLFVYTSTAEVVHHHGAGSRNLVLSVANASDNTGEVNSSAPSSSQKPGTTTECLVCQFQQNLSGAEIFTPLLLLAPAATEPGLPVSLPFFRSATISTPRGRGPPSIS
jgi:hypothetical protein